MTHAYKSLNKLQYIKAYQSRSSYKSSAATNITATMSTTQSCPDDVLHIYHCDLCNEEFKTEDELSDHVSISISKDSNLKIRFSMLLQLKP